ncbi:MAG: Choline-sulfatase [Pseudomonadota bacterium]
MKHLRTLLILGALLNALVLLFLLARDPAPDGGEAGLGAALEPLVDDATMSGARYTLGDAAPKTNLIVISMDALRMDHTGLGGHKGGLTPNLDRFGEEAVVFTHAVSAASWTLPSHMSMWTARWPSVHRVTNKLSLLGQGQMADTTLSPGIETLPNLLCQAGFACAAFTGGAGVSGRFGFNRGFGTYVDDRPFAGLDYSAPLALDWLQQHKDERFFLFLHGYDSHGQHPLPESIIQGIPYAGALDGGIEEQARLREEGLAAIQAPGQDASLVGKVGPEDATFLSAIYGKKVQQADERLGAFLDGVQRLGLLENTLVVIVSDHGDEFLEHGGLDHGHTLYEEQLHTVFVMRVPGFARKHEVDGVARTVDLFPTLLALLEQPVPAGLDGQSLLPMMRGEEPGRVAFAETDYRLFVHRRAIREGRYKLVLDLQDGERRLFDLEADPLEQRDISSGEPRRTYELEQSLKRWMTEHGTNPQHYLGIRQEPITIF